MKSKLEYGAKAGPVLAGAFDQYFYDASVDTMGEHDAPIPLCIVYIYSCILLHTARQVYTYTH